MPLSLDWTAPWWAAIRHSPLNAPKLDSWLDGLVSETVFLSYFILSDYSSCVKVQGNVSEFKVMPSTCAAFTGVLSTVASSLPFSLKHPGNSCMHSAHNSAMNPCNLLQADLQLCYVLPIFFYDLVLLVLLRETPLCWRCCSRPLSRTFQ